MGKARHPQGLCSLVYGVSWAAKPLRHPWDVGLYSFFYIRRGTCNERLRLAGEGLGTRAEIKTVADKQYMVLLGNSAGKRFNCS